MSWAPFSGAAKSPLSFYLTPFWQVKYIGADWERWDHLRGWKRERVRVKPAERVYAIEKKPQAAELWLPRLSIPQLATCYHLILLGTTTWYCLLLFVMTKMNNLTSGHNCPCCPHRWQVWKELTKDQAKSIWWHSWCASYSKRTFW